MPEEAKPSSVISPEIATEIEAPADYREYVRWRQTGEMPKKEESPPAAAETKEAPPAKTEPPSGAEEIAAAEEAEEEPELFNYPTDPKFREQFGPQGSCVARLRRPTTPPSSHVGDGSASKPSRTPVH